jgi:hypothetical protein
MVIKNSRKLMIGMIILAPHIGVLSVMIPIHSVFADIECAMDSCNAFGGNGGPGGDTGDAIGGEIGDGGSCFANDHSRIGDECGGSTGSSEPRSGSGDHSMNGGRGGEATVNLSD